jgi:hypothetical protein
MALAGMTLDQIETLGHESTVITSLVPRRFRNLVGARDVRERSKSAWRIWDVGTLGSTTFYCSILRL